MSERLISLYHIDQTINVNVRHELINFLDAYSRYIQFRLHPLASASTIIWGRSRLPP